MARLNPYTLRLQVSRLVEQGQEFFARLQVETWLKERGHNPKEYQIHFHLQPGPTGNEADKLVAIALQRIDGMPVDAWLQQEVNRHA